VEVAARAAATFAYDTEAVRIVNQEPGVVPLAALTMPGGLRCHRHAVYAIDDRVLLCRG
jgi:hypothetical protein